MDQQPAAYDIFISYAHEDADWVKSNLYEPLLRCRTAENRRPRVFFDEDGVLHGHSFVDVLASAIQHSCRVVPVYSKAYFQSAMTEWELKKFFQRAPTNADGVICPLLIEEDAERQIWFFIDHIQYRRVMLHPDWFQNLAATLDLRIDDAARTSLRFIEEPSPATVNLTMPPVKVAVTGDGQTMDYNDEICLVSEKGTLQGTTAQRAQNGHATFRDLSFREPLQATRLIAFSSGHEAAMSQPFDVITPQEIASNAQPGVPIAAHGQAFFFENGQALAVLEQSHISIWDIAGNRLGRKEIQGHPRFIRFSESLAAVATWEGQVYVLNADGRCSDYGPAGNHVSSSLRVPGSMIIRNEAAFVGYWNGEIIRFELEGKQEKCFAHDAGVQAMAMDGDAVYVAGLDAQLSVYRGAMQVFSAPLDPVLLFIKVWEACVLIVGRERVFRYAPFGGQIHTVTAPVSPITQVIEDGEFLMLMNREGTGVRYDSQLAVRGRFATTPGAKPVAVSRRHGTNCAVFTYPDGTNALLIGRRIVYCQAGGTLALAPEARLIAVGGQHGIRILDGSHLDELIQGGVREAAAD